MPTIERQSYTEECDRKNIGTADVTGCHVLRTGRARLSASGGSQSSAQPEGQVLLCPLSKKPLKLNAAMQNDTLREKMTNIVSKRHNSEDEMRSLMTLIRKRLDGMSKQDQKQYPILKLFCDWVLHTNITQSNTRLRILAKINDTLVSKRHSGDAEAIGTAISKVLFGDLRKELISVFRQMGVAGN